MCERYDLSIIIPHYNSPNLLEKLLSSIPNKNEIQTIVVDDHSSEEVRERLKVLQSHYKDKKILFLENYIEEHNAGAARNKGLKYATGDWLLFADADDYFLNGFFETIEKYFDSDYDIIYFQPSSIEIDTNNQNVRHSEYGDYIEEFLNNPCKSTEVNLRYQWLAPWSKIIKNSLVQSNGIVFDSVLVSNDVMFSIKTGFFAKRIAASKDSIYCVTRSKGTLTTKLDLATFDLRTKILIDKVNFLRPRLTKEEFKLIEAYRIAWGQLQLIWRRKYGTRVLLKYLRIFRKNKMLFDIRIFSRFRPKQWIKDRNIENAIRERYEE